jgi:hypothetical protein
MNWAQPTFDLKAGEVITGSLANAGGWNNWISLSSMQTGWSHPPQLPSPVLLLR